MSPQLIVGRAAEIHKLLESRRGSVSVVDHIGHVPSQDKRNSIPAYEITGDCNLRSLTFFDVLG